MTHRNISRLAAGTLAGIAAMLLPAGIPAASAQDQAKPRIAAHRGGALLWPENTLQAFRNAAKLGVEILELDMNLTADDEIVIMHDTSVNSEVCTPDAGSGVTYGPIRERTLAQMRKFDCGSHHRPIYPTQKPIPGARVATLDEVLSTFRKGSQLFFAETKMPKQADNVDPEHFARLVDAKVRKYGVEKRFIFQSSDYRTIDAIHRINPRIRTCLVLANRYKPHYLELARKHNAGCLVIPAKDVDEAQVRELHAADIWVFGDVADTEAMWAEHVKLGVHSIITNDPIGLRGFLKKHGR